MSCMHKKIFTNLSLHIEPYFIHLPFIEPQIPRVHSICDNLFISNATFYFNFQSTFPNRFRFFSQNFKCFLTSLYFTELRKQKQMFGPTVCISVHLYSLLPCVQINFKKFNSLFLSLYFLRHKLH